MKIRDENSLLKNQAKNSAKRKIKKISTKINQEIFVFANEKS